MEVGGGGGSGVSDGSGTGVSVGGSVTTGVPVIGDITIAVFVGRGVLVFVGRTIVGWRSGGFVGVFDGMKGVRVGDEVGDAVSVEVDVKVAVGVEVATRTWNASAVNAAAVLRFEKARSAISPRSMTIGVGRVGSERAIADVAQNKLNPSALAKKIHKSPA